LSWWCAAQNTAWNWSWQPYLGVWLMVVVLVGARLLAEVRWAPDSPDRSDELRRRLPLYITGVAVLWIGADWPVGPLGAGYLLSVHTVQYILFAFVAPPLLVAGMPRWLLRRLVQRRWGFKILRTAGRPLIAFLIFNTVLLATHLPTVVDGLTASQLGSFTVDMSWLFAGLVFWWPIIGPLPELDPMPYPGRLVYLIANVFIPTVPAAFLTYARYPIYALYELAPPVGGLTVIEDQQLAGMIMKIVGGFIVFGTASVLFFKWAKTEGGDHTSSHPGYATNPSRLNTRTR
jgi:cytochrome c oxidase assembly factor CtaG